MLYSDAAACWPFFNFVFSSCRQVTVSFCFEGKCAKLLFILKLCIRKVNKLLGNIWKFICAVHIHMFAYVHIIFVSPLIIFI